MYGLCFLETEERKWCFLKCESLERLAIPKSVNEMAEYTFPYRNTRLHIPHISPGDFIHGEISQAQCATEGFLEMVADGKDYEHFICEGYIPHICYILSYECRDDYNSEFVSLLRRAIINSGGFGDKSFTDDLMSCPFFENDAELISILIDYRKQFPEDNLF